MDLIGFLGHQRDNRGFNDKRWNEFRPSVAACMHESLGIERFYLLYSHSEFSDALLEMTTSDIKVVNPSVEVIPVRLDNGDSFDPLDVLRSIKGFIEGLPTSREYLINLSTGTHAAHIVFFDLARKNVINAKMLQIYALPVSARKSAVLGDVQKGGCRVIDLNLARYDEYESILASDKTKSEGFLKGGVVTLNKAYNELISTIERVAVRNNLPILIGGATGAGKTALAKRLYELKKAKGIATGEFKYLNCATLRADTAHSVLFGHKKGAFTGATENRTGLLHAANGGVLFLDEIATMPLDVQSMLLHAIETKKFYPMGSDIEETSNFALICGTNEDLVAASKNGSFRSDLLARIDTWSFDLPSLADRLEDIEPNLDYELAKYESDHGERIRFNTEARAKYLRFANGAKWERNFRDLSSSVLRMCTLSENGVIDEDNVASEFVRLNKSWGVVLNEPIECVSESDNDKLSVFIQDVIETYNLESRNLVQLASIREVLSVCFSSATAKEAATVIFGEGKSNPTSVINNWLASNVGCKFSELKTIKG